MTKLQLQVFQTIMSLTHMYLFNSGTQQTVFTQCAQKLHQQGKVNNFLSFLNVKYMISVYILSFFKRAGGIY